MSFIRSRGLLIPLACVLIIPFRAAEECEDDRKCFENNACLDSYDRVCNGKKDCPHGSDESFPRCKINMETMTLHHGGKNSQPFHCASGGVIEGILKCNNVTDCPDGSDELVQVCHPYKKTLLIEKLRGNCPENEFECYANKCVPDSAKCDGVIDCDNGRDESVVACWQNCVPGEELCWRCANGVRLNKSQVCNQDIDCFDGSDELPTMCGFKNETLTKCYEPEKYTFTQKTSFQTEIFVYANQSAKLEGKRFVYANEPAEVRCNHTGRRSWNVCKLDGTWDHEFCSSDVLRKPDNPDPNTNGEKGCKIENYNTTTMKILHQGKETIPPIFNKVVRLQCSGGYHLVPSSLRNQNIECHEKIWNNNPQLIPSCTRLCNYTELEKLNVFEMVCKGLSQQHISCSDENLLIPGTTVTLDCQSGFDISSTRKVPVLNCNEFGMWEEIDYLIKHQYDICKYRCNNEYKLESEAIIPMSTHPIEKRDKTDHYWLVPIYKKNETKRKLDFICNGNLIRQNIVLTAAHCIIDINANYLIVGKERDDNLIFENISDENLVSKKKTHYFYKEKDGYVNDVGLIILKKWRAVHRNHMSICLCNPAIQLNDSSGFKIYSWNAEGEIKDRSVVQTKKIDDSWIRIDVKVETATFNKGDSGSGMVRKVGNESSCLVGIVSTTLGNGARSADVINLLTVNMMQFLRE